MADQKQLCKYYKRKVVVLNRNISTRGGDHFFKGEMMIIREKTKNGPFQLARPRGIVNTDDESDFHVIGDESEILKYK